MGRFLSLLLHFCKNIFAFLKVATSNFDVCLVYMFLLRNLLFLSFSASLTKLADPVVNHVFLMTYIAIIICILLHFQLAQPMRLMLNYVGQEFEDVQYEQGDGE